MASSSSEAGDTGKSKLSEGEFLAQQVSDARLAMRAALRDLQQSLANGADVRRWTRQYPWIATGAAAVSGFTAGCLLTPRNQAEAIEQWERLKAAVARPFTRSGEVEQAAPPDAPQPQRSGGGWFSSVLGHLFRTLQPALVTMLNNLMSPGAGAAGGHNGDVPTDSRTGASIGSPGEASA